MPWPASRDAEIHFPCQGAVVNPRRQVSGRKGGTTTRDRYGIEALRQKGREGAKLAGRPTFLESLAWIRAQGHEVKLSRASVKRLLAEGHCPHCGHEFEEQSREEEKS
jgi:hypothetical protein